MSSMKSLCLACVVLIAALSLVCPQAMAQLTAQQASINQNLDYIAESLAEQLRLEPLMRNLVLIETKVSPNREQILDLATTVGQAEEQDPARAETWESIRQAMDDMDITIRGPERSEEGATRFDFYFPVEAHRLKWDGGSDLLVAYIPLETEEGTTPITAYSVKDGSVVILDPTVPPETPTLVVGLDEHESLEPSPPLMEMAPPVDADVDPCEVNADDTNSWIGVPWIYLVDDHEPWVRGAAEVYAIVVQYDGNGAVRQSKKSLTKVDHDKKWYYLGESPGSIMYFYFDQTYAPETYFRFYEADGGLSINVGAYLKFKFGGLDADAEVNVSFSIKDGDDDMGSVWVHRDAVPWNGTRRFSTGDVRIEVDKDP